MLKTVVNQLHEVRKHIETTAVTTSQIAEGLRLDWIRGFVKDIKSFMARIFFTNIAIYRAVLEIRGHLPSHLERSLYQEPFLLEDAIGRIVPVHTQFVSSWEAFDSVLQSRFRGLQGYELVRKRRYVMQDSATMRTVDQRGPWEASFLPGQKVLMSMLFEDAEKYRRNCCPNCQTPSLDPQDSETQWFDFYALYITSRLMYCAVPAVLCGTGVSRSMKRSIHSFCRPRYRIHSIY